jgi:hypothetical protein
MTIDETPTSRPESGKIQPHIGQHVQARENNAAEWFRGRGVCPAIDPENRPHQDDIRSCVP